MKKVLFITNIPSPYRIDFYNLLSEYIDLTVIFEARRVNGINFNWNDENINFKSVFLLDGDIQEKKANFKVLKYIKKGYYDFVFVTNYAYYTELIALLKIKLLRIPYILELDGALYRPEKPFRTYLKKIIINGAKKYFSPSKLTDEVLKSYGVNTERIIRYPFSSIKKDMIKDSITGKAEKERLRKELGINNERVVLFVGQFIRRKGIDTLINSAVHIKQQIGIYCVGGKATNEYKALIEKYRLDNIHFIEFLNKEELQKYYDSADVFVLPTREDVWGLVINEAMARGLPVITTKQCGAAMELVQGNGFIINAEDSYELADKINIITENDEIIEVMSRKSIEIIRKYTIEEMVRKHVEYFGGYYEK